MSGIAFRPSTAFLDTHRIADGPLASVALAVKAALALDSTAAILVFEDQTGKVVDLDLRGSDAEIAARYAPPAGTAPETPDDAPRGRGRPKLGVVAREVTLLPRHWEWLAGQRGGASAALRRLIDEARKSNAALDELRAATESSYRFMSDMASDLPGFEEASRALFARERAAFEQHTHGWPDDLRGYLCNLAEPLWK